MKISIGQVLGAALVLGAACASAAELPVDVSLKLPVAAVGVALAAPIPDAPVTSGFGWRQHPTLKCARFHAGLDYGAPMGTVIFAAGDGVIEKISRERDRGLYVVVRHSNRLVSGYAHLSAIEPGLAVGQRIEAQAALGRVGKSGRATGPHLDFEVFFDGMRVNPGSLLAAQNHAAGNHVETKRVAFNDL